MPLNPNDLAADLKTALSNSPDPAVKALTDGFYNALAVAITNHIKRGTVTGVTVNTQTGVQIAPILIT